MTTLISPNLPRAFQPVAVAADGTVYGFPKHRDPWALLNRARYGCVECDQAMDDDMLTGGTAHAAHLAEHGLFGHPGRRAAA